MSSIARPRCRSARTSARGSRAQALRVSAVRWSTSSQVVDQDAASACAAVLPVVQTSLPGGSAGPASGARAAGWRAAAGAIRRRAASAPRDCAVRSIAKRAAPWIEFGQQRDTIVRAVIAQQLAIAVRASSACSGRALARQSSLLRANGRRRLRIGNRRAAAASPKRRSARTRAPPVAHRRGKLRVEVAEVQERRGRAEFLAHEQQRRRGASSSDRDCRGAAPRGSASAVSRSPNARLPTWSWFCRKVTKAVGRQCAAGLAARRAAAMRRRLALVGEAFGQAAAEMLRAALGVVGVVAVALAGQAGVQGVVEVVVPLRGVARAARARRVARQAARLVAVVLEHEMDVRGRARDRCAHASRRARSRKCGAESSTIACTASRRRPSKWNSSSQ